MLQAVGAREPQIAAHDFANESLHCVAMVKVVEVIPGVFGCGVSGLPNGSGAEITSDPAWVARETRPAGPMPHHLCLQPGDTGDKVEDQSHFKVLESSWNTAKSSGTLPTMRAGARSWHIFEPEVLTIIVPEVLFKISLPEVPSSSCRRSS